jgi:HK97 family phage major capsid protein
MTIDIKIPQHLIDKHGRAELESYIQKRLADSIYQLTREYEDRRINGTGTGTPKGILS